MMGASNGVDAATDPRNPIVHTVIEPSGSSGWVIALKWSFNACVYPPFRIPECICVHQPIFRH